MPKELKNAKIQLPQGKTVVSELDNILKNKRHKGVPNFHEHLPT